MVLLRCNCMEKWGVFLFSCLHLLAKFNAPDFGHENGDKKILRPRTRYLTCHKNPTTHPADRWFAFGVCSQMSCQMGVSKVQDLANLSENHHNAMPFNSFTQKAGWGPPNSAQ